MSLEFIIAEYFKFIFVELLYRTFTEYTSVLDLKWCSGYRFEMIVLIVPRCAYFCVSKIIASYFAYSAFFQEIILTCLYFYNRIKCLNKSSLSASKGLSYILLCDVFFYFICVKLSLSNFFQNTFLVLKDAKMPAG